MIKPIFLKEGFRMLKRSLKVKKTGFVKYKGDAKDICKQIVDNCYNKEKDYFMASTGHFSEFWTRDFGLCVKALKELGYEKEIVNTLNYVLNIFKKKNGLTTTITPNEKSFDFPTYAPDSLAFTLHSLVVCNDQELIKKYSFFLENEAKRLFKRVIDKKTGLVKKKHFSSMRDQVIRKSSCYDNVMVAWISKNLDVLGFENPFTYFDYRKIIIDNFWNKEFFIDDLSGKKCITADANIFPFWTGLFDSKKMIKSSVEKLIALKFDKPLPINYSIEKPRVVWYAFLAKDYEFNKVWPMIGYPFIEVSSIIDKELAKNYLEKYSKTIEKFGTFLELFDLNAKPFKTVFYTADEGMLWASMHLYLLYFIS